MKADTPAAKPKEIRHVMFQDTAQQSAIYENIARGTGNLLVIARAGSGKTTVIEKGVTCVPASKSVLVVAFNRDIGDVLRKRIRRDGPTTVGTCHSYGLASLRAAMGAVDVDARRASRIASDMRFNLTTRNYTLTRALSLAKGMMLETSRAVLAACDERSMEILDDRERFASAVLRLKDRCAVLDGTVDFDDMIWLPVIHEGVVEPYDYVFVDEVQDLNAAQAALIEKACAPGGRIIAIGDDRQAIYNFRGADADAVNHLRKRLEPKELPLSVSFRCSRAVIAEAQRVVPDITARDDAPQGSVTTVSYESMLDMVEYGDFILSRTNAPLLRIALKLVRTECAVHIAGRELGDDLIALIKRTRGRTVADVLRGAQHWRDKALRIVAEQGNTRGALDVTDKYECIAALAEGATSVNMITQRISELFASTPSDDCVTLSSTHRAKGLERNRVFMLRDTYLRNRKYAASKGEEMNLYYVAVTRAKNDLFLVTGGLKGA